MLNPPPDVSVDTERLDRAGRRALQLTIRHGDDTSAAPEPAYRGLRTHPRSHTTDNAEPHLRRYIDADNAPHTITNAFP